MVHQRPLLQAASLEPSLSRAHILFTVNLLLPHVYVGSTDPCEGGTVGPDFKLKEPQVLTDVSWQIMCRGAG